MGGPSFGQWLGAAVALVIGVSLLESWDARIAYAVAVLTILAIFFSRSATIDGLIQSLGIRPVT